MTHDIKIQRRPLAVGRRQREEGKEGGNEEGKKKTEEGGKEEREKELEENRDANWKPTLRLQINF